MEYKNGRNTFFKKYDAIHVPSGIQGIP